MAEATLAQFVSVRGRFHRSVHLARDWNDRASLGSYVATPTVCELVQRIASALPDPLGSRAWSITGPFGSGKSALAAFLLDVLAHRRPVHPMAKVVRRAAKLRLAPLLPVIVVGRRAPLTPALLMTLAETLRPINPDFADRLQRTEGIDAEELWQLVDEALIVAATAGYSGLAIVIDEFGKFLEYAALHPAGDDIFVLQHLAEGAARAPGRMALLTIQHSAFADYLPNGSHIQAAEWQKVQGRFTDIAFHLPSEQLLGLLGASLEADWPIELSHAYAAWLDAAVTSAAFLEARRRAPIDDLLPATIPLDPISALLLWPLFRGKMAQNERSLFAFLTSHEPFGFQEFLQTAIWNGATAPLYRVDRLYDYVTTAIGSAALLGDRARHWAEIQQALERLPGEAPVAAPAVVKAIGLLGLYGMSVGLKATLETLELALADRAGVIEALAFLERKSFVVQRRHQGDLALWEGSDVDLDACYEHALQHVAGGGLAERITRVARPRPWIARAHYIQTGTLRYFDVKVVDGSPSHLAAALDRALAESRGDGVIIFVLTVPSADRAVLAAEAQAFTADAATRVNARLCIVAFPDPVAGVEEATVELEAWQWVNDHEPALARDAVARQEVRARLVAAHERLGHLVGSVLGMTGHSFNPGSSDWIYAGDQQPGRSPREFSRWLSDLCNDSFSQAPVLRNELLNRNQLSSAAAKARRNLLEAMLTREHRQRLGFVGAPPEATMYDAMLLASGLHRLRDGHWAFGEPSSDWCPVWKVIQGFLAETTETPQPVTELMARLQQPPFGLRSGPIPVLLLAALLSHGDEIALYEQGIFLPELRIEAIERFLRKPDDFTLRLFRSTDASRQVLRALARVTAPADSGALVVGQDQLVAIVKPLVVFAAQLVPYARQTRRFDDPIVVAVRQALLRATDPYELVFRELPAVTGVDLAADDGAEDLADRLHHVVKALESAYLTLLLEIETALCDAFGLTAKGGDAARQLRERAQALVRFAVDRRLNTFIREAVRETSDWREGLGRVVADGTPPSQWKDADIVTFHTRLQLLASDFVRLEALAAEHGKAGENTTIVRVDILNGRLEEARALVSVPPEVEPAVDALLERVSLALDEFGSESDDQRARVAALARALTRELATMTGVKEP